MGLSGVMSLRDDLDRMLAEYDKPPMSDEQWTALRAMTHLRVAENTTLCERGSGTVGLAGQWLTDDPSEVGCRGCEEWMHA